MKSTVFTIAAMLASLGAAQAQTTATEPAKAPVRFLAGVGFAFGGEELAWVDLNKDSRAVIYGGSGFVFTTGVDYRLSPEFSVQGTVNYLVDTAKGANASVKFQRFPIEFLGYYHPSANWRIGGGLRYVSSPTLSGTGGARGLDVNFDNAISGVVEAEYLWTPRLGIKMRFVNESFNVPGYGNIGANHIGATANWYF